MSKEAAKRVLEQIEKALFDIRNNYEALKNFTEIDKNEEISNHNSIVQTPQIGGQILKKESESFDIILNILIGIRRSISNLYEIPGIQLDMWQFEKKLCTENEWVQNTSQKNARISKFKFYDYAPLVFQRLRSRDGIKEDFYMKSLGPEQIISSFWTNNYNTLIELVSSG